MPDRAGRFEALAREVAEPLHRYAVRRVGPDLAQDVVADALLVLWRRLDDVPDGNPLPWCYGVARLCVSNARRSRRRRLSLVARITTLQDRPELDWAGDVDRDADLHDALGRLPEGDREVLRLWAWESLPPAEIAVVLEISANAAAIRLHRARKRLAEEIAGPRKVGDVAGPEEVQERRTP
jgi:RNA polymerase sigma-70 factor (ECF subfamily)